MRRMVGCLLEIVDGSQGCHFRLLRQVLLRRTHLVCQEIIHRTRLGMFRIHLLGHEIGLRRCLGPLLAAYRQLLRDGQMTVTPPGNDLAVWMMEERITTHRRSD